MVSCGSNGPPPSAPSTPAAFGNPEPVTINGYSGDVMEPFISRDGVYLFFNNAGGTTDKDLFFATYVTSTTFQYQGAISAINSPTVDGAPTVDSGDRLYYVSLATYGTDLTTVHSGLWNGSTVIGSAPLSSLTITTPLVLYFDVESDPSGSTLYLSEGEFTGGVAIPKTADLVVSVYTSSGFVRDPNSAVMMARVNTGMLEYAPAISADSLELFFTRLDPGTLEARIYQTLRSSITSPFGPPQLVSAIDGFVEGPALSPDERSLYYHRLNTFTNKFELYRVTRP
jgi:hypothetical protein